MANFDLNLLRIFRQGGQDFPAQPGIYGATPPRRTARGREQDRLVVYLSLTGTTAFTTQDYTEFTHQMAERFYATAGSVTGALKITAESLNAFLMDRNNRLTGRGQSGVGLLVLGVLRDNNFYMLLCGNVHAFWMSEHGARHYYDPQLSGRGLGVQQTTRMYTALAELHAGDRLLLGTQIADAWIPALEGDNKTGSLESTRRRLLADNTPDLNAVLIQAVAGKGEINLVKAGQADAPSLTPAPTPAPQGTLPPQHPPVQTTPLPPFIRPTESVAKPTVQPAPAPSAPVTAIPQATPAVTPVARPAATTPPPSATTAPAADAQPAAAAVHPLTSPLARQAKEESPEPKLLVRLEPARFRPLFQALAKLIQVTRDVGQTISHFFNSLTRRLLPHPHEDDAPPTDSPSWIKPVIILLIPLIAIAISTVVYNEVGRPAEYARYYKLAQDEAVQTVGQANALEARRAWEATLYWLDEAEKYQVTGASDALRRQAQASLDQIDKVVRLNFQLALPSQLSANVAVTRLTASESDVFMLNSANGQILRAYLTGRGYELDVNFQCGPGFYGENSLQVGTLVDLVAMPRSNLYGALVAGIDAQGHLLYCAADVEPTAVILPNPPTGWKQITAIWFDNNNLYVLDPSANAAWSFVGDQGLFDLPPTFFFGEQIPPMADVIDMAVSGDDLYLLHADGHLTFCRLSLLTVSPTRCTEPAIYKDTRPGKEPATVLPDAIFTQLSITAPPDSAVALLEPNTPAAFRFSARELELRNQLRAYAAPNNPLPAGRVAAMAFSPNHILFIVVDNHLYYATDVP